MRVVVIASLLAGMTAAGQAQSNGSGASAAASITAEDVRRRIEIIADDSMRGRDTPSLELEQVAQYIASEFRRLGLKPGGDGESFVQRYTLHWVQPDIASGGIRLESGPTWRFGQDVLRRFGGTDAEGVSGHVVVISGTPTDASPMPTALDLSGMIAVLVPPLTPEGQFGPAIGPMFQAVAEAAPAAILLVSGPPDGTWQARLQRPERPRLVPSWTADDEPLIVEVRDPTIAPVLAAQGFELGAARQGTGVAVRHLTDLRMTITLPAMVTDSVTAPNVAGILEGSDPTLKNEYVVYSAHMDHVGVGRPVAGDSIYNGADDDASGTVAVVELAEAFALTNPRPKRSMIFLTVSGEEKGLWGSDYFAARPPVSIEQIVANLNMDMIGRNWPDTIVVIGREHSDLGATLARVNAAHPELGMTAIDDIWPEERFYYRSDHFNFARRGVPILFFFSGTHQDYHRPSDHVEKIDADKEARIVRLVFYLGLEVGNAAQRPEWDPVSYKQIVEGTPY
jgi:hypothetical protein